jgi:hypothetical protein
MGSSANDAVAATSDSSTTVTFATTAPLMLRHRR